MLSIANIIWSFSILSWSSREVYAIFYKLVVICFDVCFPIRVRPRCLHSDTGQEIFTPGEREKIID